MLCIEWLDPLYLAGHWVPELVTAAGGKDVGAEPGAIPPGASGRSFAGSRPDHIIVMLCGFGVERARTELDARDPDALELMHRVPTWIIDGNAYTSRPGPRVVDGAAADPVGPAATGRQRRRIVANRGMLTIVNAMAVDGGLTVRSLLRNTLRPWTSTFAFRASPRNWLVCPVTMHHQGAACCSPCRMARPPAV